MKIFLASDHSGFELKKQLVTFAGELGHETEDLGPFSLDQDDDYPDFITPLAERAAAERESRGIILGGSGQGEAMAANRVRGARAAVFYGGNLDIIKAAREHNDANILSLGARFVSLEEAKQAVGAFLSTPFSGDARHVRRIAKF